MVSLRYYIICSSYLKLLMLVLFLIRAEMINQNNNLLCEWFFFFFSKQKTPTVLWVQLLKCDDFLLLCFRSVWGKCLCWWHKTRRRYLGLRKINGQFFITFLYFIDYTINWKNNWLMNWYVPPPLLYSQFELECAAFLHRE